MFTEKSLIPRLDFTRLKSGELISRATAIYTGVTADPKSFPHPNVDLNSIKTMADAYGAAVSAALDGGKMAIAARDKLRGELIKALRVLGQYVASCHVDRPVFLASGFEPRTTERVRSPQPLNKPAITGLEQGKTGQLLVSLKAVGRARHYEVRYAAIVDGVVPAWSSEFAASARGAVPINNLTPGRIYTFEARAFGSQGHTDWSGSASRMCI